jgi:hypothetical protein
VHLAEVVEVRLELTNHLVSLCVSVHTYIYAMQLEGFASVDLPTNGAGWSGILCGTTDDTRPDSPVSCSRDSHRRDGW